MSDKKLNWFKRHKALTVIGGIIILIVIVGSASGGSKNGSKSNSPAKKTAESTATTRASNATTQTAAKSAARQPQGTATTLGAGSFTGGKDVVAGLYDVTPGPDQSGNFIVQGTDSYNEILGNADAAGGVDKVRVKISNGDKIQISGLTNVAFTPVTAVFVTNHAAATLYAGTFTVGEDVGSGRYIVTPGSGQSGNFIVNGANNYNEILGGDSAYGGVPNVLVSLTNGDKITISGLSQVTFTPSN